MTRRTDAMEAARTWLADRMDLGDAAAVLMQVHFPTDDPTDGLPYTVEELAALLARGVAAGATIEQMGEAAGLTPRAARLLLDAHRAEVTAAS